MCCCFRSGLLEVEWLEQSTGSIFQFSAIALSGQCFHFVRSMNCNACWLVNNGHILLEFMPWVLSNICCSHCLGFCFKSEGALSNIILCETLISESKSSRAFLTVSLQNQKLGSTGGCTGVKKTENGGWCRTLFVVSHQLAGVPCSNARHVLALVSSAAINYR